MSAMQPENPGLIVKLRPLGPWRSGPASGARNRVDPIYHSDSLFSAVTGAMGLLGSLEEWLDATARAPGTAAVRFSSCFPFHGDLGFIVPPRTIWPPPASAKVRWKGARFVPLPLIEALLAGKVLEEERWTVDGPSECLVPAGKRGPFRVGVRRNAAVDRLEESVAPHATACLEFSPEAGLWAIVSFSDEAAQSRWSTPLQGALRLLADSGFGGERSRGWGRCEAPEFTEGSLPDLILPPRAAAIEAEAPLSSPETTADSVSSKPSDLGADPLPADAPSEEAATHAEGEGKGVEQAYWLLSLFAPAPGDSVNWERGNYSLVTRGGRIESPVRCGETKKLLDMVSEGSVVFAAGAVRGAAADVAPDGFPHPVFRAGFALAIPIPAQAPL